jgi:hypothetical protein
LPHLVQIRVVEDDGRRFAAEFQCHPADPVGNRGHDPAARCGAAGETDLVHSGVGNEFGPDFAAAVDHVDHPGRHLSSVDQLCDDVGENHCCERCFGRGLQYDRTSCGESGTHLQASDGQRTVPGCDGGHHTYRLLKDSSDLPVRARAVRPEWELSRLLGVVAKTAHGAAVTGLTESGRSTDLCCLQRGDLLGALVERIGDRIEDRSAIIRCCLRPRPIVESGAGSIDCSANIGRRCLPDSGNDLFGGRVHDTQHCLPGGGRPAPRDECVVVFGHGRRNIGLCSHCELLWRVLFAVTRYDCAIGRGESFAVFVVAGRPSGTAPCVKPG